MKIFVKHFPKKRLTNTNTNKAEKKSFITLHYITLHYITLHYITLHYITLHYITLHSKNSQGYDEFSMKI
jgi:hypothetical protein